MSLSYPEVISKLVSVSTFDEATKQEMQAAIVERHQEILDSQSDEEKSARPAPINQLAATKPAMFSGGLSEDQVNAIVAKAIKQDREGRDNVKTPVATEPAATNTAESTAAATAPPATTPPATTASPQANG